MGAVRQQPPIGEFAQGMLHFARVEVGDRSYPLEVGLADHCKRFECATS